ncbi:hypothetical protein [Nocardia tengchongensis]
MVATGIDAGVLDPDQVKALRISDQELDACEFCSIGEAERRLSPRMWSRARAALAAHAAGRVAYLQDGRPFEQRVAGWGRDAGIRPTP